MTKTRYREITLDQFASSMAALGFKELPASHCNERVYGRRISAGPMPSRFAVAVFSSVDKRDSVSRECGSDAIRVVVLDTCMLDENKHATVIGGITRRVHRTESALANIKDRMLVARNYVADPSNYCPSCNSLMAPRKGRRGPFMACTSMACKVTRPMVAEVVRKAA